jgi:ABC-type multidrug transport system fused ATPase/permease subunit
MSENRQNKNTGRGPMGDRRGGPMGGGFGRPVEKAKDFKGTFKRLIHYLKPHRMHLIIVLIFAIASTSFTIAAPKITSKAMNKLQDAYMARKMMSGVEDGQKLGIDKINEKMAEEQNKAVDELVNNMVESQQKAVDQITKNMGDAQAKAADEIYKGIAIQLYNGVLSGQKAAVNQITAQMAAAQRAMIAQINQPLPPGVTPPPMDPATLGAIQKLMQLPVIDTITDTSKKTQTVIEFIDILQGMPAGMGSPEMDPKTLGTLKQLLSIPMLGTAKSPSQKISIIKDFMAVSKNMPGSGAQAQNSSIKLDSDMMDKALAKIPEIKSFKSTSSSTAKMNKTQMDAVQKLLKLPLLNDIKDPKVKNDTLLQLIDIFEEMPDMSGSSTNTGTQINTKDLDTVKEFLQLADISSIKDPVQKREAVKKALDIFSKMPDMGSSSGSNNSGQTLDPEQLKNAQKLLELPMISTISDSQQKTETTIKLLDIFSSMPDIQSKSNNTDSQNSFNTQTIKDLKEFLSLPALSTLTDPNQKADEVKKIMDLQETLEGSMKDASTNPKGDVKFTDAQIDSAIKAIRETNGKYDFHYIGIIALILIGMYLISALFSLIMGLVMSGVSQRTVRDLRREVDSKLSRLPLKYFDLHPHGDILSRVTNDVDTISTTLQQSLTQIITSVITIIGYIIMMLTISPVLTLIVIATLPLYVMSTMFIAKKSQKFFAVQQKALGELSGHVEEMYTGHKIVKAFGHEKDSIEEFEAINERLKDAGWRAQFVSGIMFPLMNFISNLGYVGISIVGGIWITKSLLGLGDILAFIQYSRSFTMPIVQTANIANIIQSTVACAERVFEILDEEEEIPDSSDAVVLEKPRGEVRFDRVAFSYKEDVPLIENMNLHVKEGDTIAIVGPTGAGKTTLVNLLMRFYEINSGKISVDGVNINDIRRSELRKMFGMVLQDTWLYNGTIKDNIAYGKEGATMEEIVSAAKAAHADRFIRTLPQGYDTILNEEATNISQGQKQLLTIARAILADPAILILDEATSSVDTRTEVLIQKAMANLMKGRTSFVIAHRLSTIRDAEQILVMNKGSIIEMGNHKELLNKGGFYADLYNSQFAGADLEEVAV